ncbi:MAG TPA: glycosyltransferase [Gemmatimonadales bacterium]|jgi:hypothetical protein
MRSRDQGEGQIPALSVVVPSVNGWSDLEGCLAALAAQDLDRPIEILVADRVGDAVRAPLRSRFPSARLIEAAPGTTIPDLRAMAFDAARADVVGVIEDHVLVPADWARAMLALQGAGETVVGGSVRNAATENLVDRAAFLCEYHQALAPASGSSHGVTGNNVTYRRALLSSHRDAWARGRWENDLQAALRADGVVLHSHPEIVVQHNMHYTVGSYLEQRYLYSRSFAAMRTQQSGVAIRMLMGLLSLALPPLLLARIVSRVYAVPGYRGQLLPALPLIALFTLSWAWGEAVGCWAGPGDALARVR